MRTLGRRAARAGVALAVLAGVAGCGENEAPDDETDPLRAPEIARIVPAEEALTGTRLETLDPATMNDAELRKGIGTGPRCEFRYTTAGRPVLAASMRPNEQPTAGILKLNGDLVALAPATTNGPDEPNSAFRMGAGRITIAVTPDRERGDARDDVLRREADMVFQVGQSLRVGYRGYLDCTAKPPVVSQRH